MPSTNKLTYHRRAEHKGPKRQKPPVRALNQAIRSQVDRERALVQLLTADAYFRASQLGTRRAPADPLLVWWDFDQFRDRTNIGSEHLPRWNDVGDFLKFHLILRASLIFGGYSFTARVRQDLQAKWLSEGRSPSDRIYRLITNAVSEYGLGNQAFCYVMEGKSRRGYGRTSLHIHGILQTDDPHVGTRFKVMLEQAISSHAKGKAAAGFAKHSGSPVELKPIYDSGSPQNGTAGKWATYFTKNALRPESRLGGKRTHISQEARRLAREMWAFMRQETP